MAIALDSASPSVTGADSSMGITYAHTVGSGSNRYLAVFVGTFSSSNAPSGITYNGVSMSLVKEERGTSTTTDAFCYGLANPTSGTANVVVSFAGSNNFSSVAHSWTGVNQSTSTRTASSTAATSGTSTSLTPTSSVNDMVVNGLAVANTGTFTQTAPQTLLTKGEYTIGRWIGTSYKAGASPTTSMGWGWSFSGQFTHISYALIPAVDAPSTIATGVGVSGICGMTMNTSTISIGYCG